MLLRAWRDARFVLHAPIPPEELVIRLKAGVAPSWAFASRRPVVGLVGASVLWLRMRGTIISRNSMQPHLFARLSATPGGTRMECRFILHPIVLAFFGMWLVLLTTLLGRVAMNFARGTATDGPDGLLPLALMAAAVAVLGIAAIGYHFARNDRAALLTFLKDEVGAGPG